MENNILVIVNNESDYNYLSENLLTLQIDTKNIIRCQSIEDSFLLSSSDLYLIIVCYPIKGIGHTTGIQLIKRHFTNIPIIVITNEESDLDELGKTDFLPAWLPKNNFDAILLESAISNAIEQNNNIYKIEFKHANYKRHFYNSDIPMWIYDTDSLQILEVNNAAVSKYGFTKEEFIALNTIDLHPKEDIESFIEAHENRQQDQFDAGYWRHVKKNGEIFFVNIYSHYTNYDDKETGLTFAFDVNDKLLEDLTNKNSKNLIKGQKEQFDSILSTLSDAIWSIRADTLELIYANQAFYTLFGFSPEEMTADIDPFFSLIHPDDQMNFRRSMQGVTYAGSAKVEYRYNHRDGTQKILQAHVSLIKGSEGKPDTLNGVTVDVTNERTLQDKIRKSEQNLLATINNTKDLIWSVNTNLEIIFCNKPYQEYIYQLSRTIPRPGDYVLGEWGSDSFINQRKNDYNRALAGESFITVMEENFNGAILYKEFSNNPILDHDGKIIGVNCIARDISEQRRQFMKIQEQNEKLIEIAWIQSHKVRSPVAKILGLAELFDYEANGNENNCEILEMMKSSTKELDSIIKEVVEKTEILGEQK